VAAYGVITKDSIAGLTGQLLNLRGWQQQLYRRTFARDPQTDRRLHRTAYWSMGRKNGKTSAVAPIALNALTFGEGAEVYCLDPNARALCADLVWRPIGDLSVGDELLAFDEHAAGGYRKLRYATVESTARIFQQAFRLVFTDGREVVASATHRWVAHRGRSGGISEWVETRSLRPGSRIRDLGTPWVTDESRGGGYLAGLFDGVSEATIATVEPIGEREVVALGTSTGTLFVEGLFSHNSCAADRDQARIVFGAAVRTVELTDLSERFKVFRTSHTIEDPKTGGIYRALSAEAYTKEGLSPTLVIADELHAWPTRELYDVMALAMGTRVDPLMLIVTTAGVRTDTTGQDSICYTLYQYGRRVAAGEIDDPTFFFACWEAEDLALDDERGHRQANPGYGDILDAAELRVQARRALTGGMAESEFRIKRRNQWVASTLAAVPAGLFEKQARPRQLQPGEKIVVFFDGSFNHDCTALLGATLDGHLGVLGCWERPLDNPAWRVPLAEVMAMIRELPKTYDVVEIAMDPFRWAQQIEELGAEGLPIIEYPTSSPARMVPAWAKFQDALLGGRITHDGDPRLVRHISNMTIKIDRLGPRPVKEHRGSPRVIDLGICAVGAYDRATYHAAAPIAASVYETRGFLVLRRRSDDEAASGAPA